MRVLLVGASGTIGAPLTLFLKARGHNVELLQRGSSVWNPERGIISYGCVEGFDVIINLAGYPITSGRWTKQRMEMIKKSRLVSTKLLAEAICQQKVPPSLFISASAIGYYGDRGDEALDETSSSGKGFLAELCESWEAKAKKAEAVGTRVVLLRSGIVLTNVSGALAKMLPIFRLGLGGRLGSGKQWMSWIAIDDMLSLINFVIETPQIIGPVNATSPFPVTNKVFTDQLAIALKRPAILPVPGWILRFLLGKFADEALLSSVRAYPRKLAAAGFSFSYPELSQVFSHLLYNL